MPRPQSGSNAPTVAAHATQGAAKVVVNDYNDIFSDYDPSRNTTRNVLNRYEKASVLSLRMEQLVRGAPPCVDAEGLGLKTMQDIAVKELELRRLPFIIVRTLPNDDKEYWKLQDMICLRD